MEPGLIVRVRVMVGVGCGAWTVCQCLVRVSESRHETSPYRALTGFSLQHHYLQTFRYEILLRSRRQ